MLLALLKFMFSSVGSTEEKDYFQIVREKMLVLLLFMSLTVISVSSLCTALACSCHWEAVV